MAPAQGEQVLRPRPERSRRPAHAGGPQLTRPERDAHVRRVGYLASRLEQHGVFVVASFVSPYRESRDFVRGLSDDSRYNRFMGQLRELAPRKLQYMTTIDYDQHMALIATVMRDGHEVEIGVARYVVTPGSDRHLCDRTRKRCTAD